jgi:predicted TIM-barrel fold metal-dependent hydrolase
MTSEDFADHAIVRLLENLDTVGRSRVLGSLTAEARDCLGVTAAANRRRQRDDLIRCLAATIAPNASANRAAIEIEVAAKRYQASGWLKHSAAGTRPLNDPNRSLHRFLELTDGDPLSARSIRRILD